VTPSGHESDQLPVGNRKALKTHAEVNLPFLELRDEAVAERLPSSDQLFRCHIGWK